MMLRVKGEKLGTLSSVLYVLVDNWKSSFVSAMLLSATDFLSFSFFLDEFGLNWREEA